MATSTMMKKLSIATAGAAIMALGVGGAAQAFQIGSSAFGSGAVIESFEGLSAGSNKHLQKLPKPL